MELKHRYKENGIQDDLSLIRQDGDYLTTIVKRHYININDFNHVFDQIRYYDKNGIYIKTLNIMVIENILLENELFYISFTKESIYLPINDIRKFSYGLFSKRLIGYDENSKYNENNKGIINFYGKQFDEFTYDESKYNYTIFYPEYFFKKYSDYPFIGLDYEPTIVNLTKYFASFANKSKNGNCFIYLFIEEKMIGEKLILPLPTFCLRNKINIYEDDEITWNPYKSDVIIFL